MSIDQFDLDARLAELAARIEAPDVPVADDVARGRRRQRRSRLVAAGAVVATVAVIGTAVVVTPDLLRADSGPDLVDRSGSPPPSSAEPTASATASASPAPTGWQARVETLVGYSQVLAEHLDPQGQHLERLTADSPNEQVGASGDRLTSLGTKLGWTNDGEDGLGMVQISVSTNWRNADWWCVGEGWTCRNLTADGRVRIAEQDGARKVAVEHSDGEVVVITLDPLFGNNSLVPVSGLDISDKQLVRAASDPRLDLPAGLRLPGQLDIATLEAVGDELLLPPGESLGRARARGFMDVYVEGRWLVGGADQGHLRWEASQIYGPGARWARCIKFQFVRCEQTTYDGKDVFVGHVRPRWGGGWTVAHVGATHEVSVGYEPSKGGEEFPLERAYALVTDDRLQP